MSIISIDIGTSTTKIIEYDNNKILNEEIYSNKNPEYVLEHFIEKNEIIPKNIKCIVTTGIGAKILNSNKWNIPVKAVPEFMAIAEGGIYLSNKKEALVVSIGTGTALIKVDENSIKHLGGTGVGAGTLINLCNLVTGINNFEEIIECAKKGDLRNIDLRIGDITEEEIPTLPKDLTLSNFGNLNKNAKKEDLVLGIINMVFEVIGMMAAFSIKNDTIKNVVLIGNIVKIPRVKEILEKIEKLQIIKFIIPENPEFAVAIGAIKATEILQKYNN